MNCTDDKRNEIVSYFFKIIADFYGIRTSRPSENENLVIQKTGEWYVGITNNCEKRKAEHKSEDRLEDDIFFCYDAGSEDCAREIEDHMHETYGLIKSAKKVDKMREKIAEKQAPSRYVYIFKIEPPLHLADE